MKRRHKDFLLNMISVVSSLISVTVLCLIITYLFNNGSSSIDHHLLFGDYYPKSSNAEVCKDYEQLAMNDYQGEGYYSKKWGIAFKDIESKHKEKEISVVYVDENSPFNHLKSLVAGEDGASKFMKDGDLIQNIYYIDSLGETIFLPKARMQNAENLRDLLENEAKEIVSCGYQTIGGGIRGSIIVTLYLIAIALLIALPIGISSAIYLHEYASKNYFTSLIRQGINLLTGVPSVVYGLMGVTVLFPITQLFGATSTSVLLGSLTLAIILLPTIISATEEALAVIPQGLKDASLSLGATKSQTIFKVVLPAAIHGILTATLLSIGRIIGESAALVYTTSTVINDHPHILNQGASLALTIWTIMAGEQPNYELASAISLIILIIVFAINIIVKNASKKLAKRYIG